MKYLLIFILFVLSSCVHKSPELTPEVKAPEVVVKDSTPSESQSSPNLTPELPPIIDVTGLEAKVFKMREIDTFEFNMVCWNIDGDKKLTYRENTQVVSFSDDSIGIKENGELVFTNPNCIMEATEKSKNVSYDKSNKFSFNCLMDKYAVAGANYYFVDFLSRSAIWLINPEDGQNIIISKNLCQLFKK